MTTEPKHVVRIGEYFAETSFRYVVKVLAIQFADINNVSCKTPQVLYRVVKNGKEYSVSSEDFDRRFIPVPYEAFLPSLPKFLFAVSILGCVLYYVLR
jgi:hypothetical protein